MASLAEELAHVLEAAVEGLDLEDRGLVTLALNHYYRAHNRLDACLEQQQRHSAAGGSCADGAAEVNDCNSNGCTSTWQPVSPLVLEACRGLLETYSARIKALQTKIQLEDQQMALLGAPLLLTPPGSHSHPLLLARATAGGAAAPTIHRAACAASPPALGSQTYPPAPAAAAVPPPAGTAQSHPALVSRGISPSSFNLVPPHCHYPPPLQTQFPGHQQLNNHAGGLDEMDCQDALQAQHQANPSAAGGGGGGEEHAGAERVLETLRQCQRAVSGSLDDLAGLEEVKRDLRQAVLLPRHLPHLFRGLRRPPRNFLMHGPPGTGKTMLVEKVASEAGMTLLAASPSSVLSKWTGESEKAMRGLFEAARAMQPSVIFIDEIDSLAPSRSGIDDPMARRLLTELLLQMTSLDNDPTCDACYVFAATNRIQDCDAALLRRFDRRILVGLPDAPARAAHLRALLAGPELGGGGLGEGEMAELVTLTQGYSGSDLTQLCREAAMAPLNDLMQQPGLLKHLRAADAAAAAAASADARAALRSDDGDVGMGEEEVGWEGEGEGEEGENCRRYGGACMLDQGHVCGGSDGAGGSGSVADAAAWLDMEGQGARGCSGSGNGGGGDAGGGTYCMFAAGGRVSLRPVTMSDFRAALAKVRPPAEDQAQHAGQT